MEEEKKYISKNELSKHCKEGDLWISIQGKIYDVTEWSRSHPGGSTPLTTLAGNEVTDAFIAYHPGTAWAQLANLWTGYHLLDYEVSELSRDYRRLHSEISKAGMFERKGNIAAITLISLIVLLSSSVSLVLLSNGLSAHLIAAALMGCLWIQSGWLGHDSGHYQMIGNRKVNRMAQLLTGNCLAGISIAWWKWNHNAHHIACNSLDFDPDLQHIPFFAVSSSLFSSIFSQFYKRILPFSPVARFLISYQHITFYPVMCFARINLFSQSIILLTDTRKKVAGRAGEIAGVVLFWIWYPLLVSRLPTWQERAMFVVVSFSVTGIQHIQFCLNHFSSKVYMGAPKGNDWFENQTKGTMDIECATWMDWFHGGLQFQVAHHLFPRLPRCHLRAVSPLVRDMCKKHSLPYTVASFWGANLLTLRTLRSSALQARNLLWEAINTIG